MAGIFQRISLIFRAKTDKALDKLEDPRQTLDYSYQRQLELLQKVRRGVADVATSRKRVELQANAAQHPGRQADPAGAEGARGRPGGPGPRGADPALRDAAADRPTCRPSTRSCRVRRRSSPAPASGCRPRSTPSGPARRRSRRPTPRPRRRPGSTRRSPASARRWATSAWPSSGPRTRPQQMQARAGAIDELLASGALDDPTGTAKDDITLELEQLASTSDVENELARMKASIGAGPAARRRPSRVSRPPAAGRSRRPGSAGAARRAATRRRRPRRPAPPASRTRGTCDDRPHPRRGSVGASSDARRRAERAGRRGRAGRGRPATRRSSARRCTRCWSRSARPGTPVPDDELPDSDLILPDADATLEEVRELLSGSDEGLVPNS